jgi:pyridoxal phosphate enzyme (YggS family)
VTEITYHLAEVRERVRAALVRCGRPTGDVNIVAVSKQQSVEAIETLFHQSQKHFGENYVQEALPKMDRLKCLPIEWHFVGRVQANKTKAIAERFQWVHTLDRLKIAIRLAEQRPYHAPPLNVLIQVNQANEKQKAGVPESQVQELAFAVSALPRLRLRGLMTMPPAEPQAPPVEFFRRLRLLKDRLVADGLNLDSLSMGMSADFELAVLEGATWVRIGTAIFGARAG